MGEHVCPPWLSFLLTNVFRRMAHDPGRILARFLEEVIRLSRAVVFRRH